MGHGSVADVLESFSGFALLGTELRALYVIGRGSAPQWGILGKGSTSEPCPQLLTKSPMLAGVRGAPVPFEISPGQKPREFWGAMADV